MLEAIALLFRISEEDRKVMLSSGNQAVFDKRGGWVKTCLITLVTSSLLTGK